MPLLNRSHVVALIAFALLPACGGPSPSFDASPLDGAVDAHATDVFDAAVDVHATDVALDASDVVHALDATDASDAADAPVDVPGVDIVMSDVPVIPVHLSPLALSRGTPDSPGGLFTSSCALHDDGTVRCWGSNYYGSPPRLMEAVTSDTRDPPSSRSPSSTRRPSRSRTPRGESRMTVS